MSMTDWKAYNLQQLAKIPATERLRAVEFLRGAISDEVKTQIRDVEKSNPQEWWVPYHMFWGMGVRNLLRMNGFGEKELCVENLDDVYIGLVEEALL